MTAYWSELDERLAREEQERVEQAYRDFMNLDYKVRGQLIEAWNAYFKQVHDTSPHAKAFFDLKNAVVNGGKVKSVKVVGVEMIPKPSEYDPLYLISKHRLAVRNQERMEKSTSKRQRNDQFTRDVKKSMY